MEDEEEQERAGREKFKREREEDSAKEANTTNPKRERNTSPSDSRGRKKEKYDDFGRTIRDDREGSKERSRERSKERERSRERSRERYPDRDSYRPHSQGRGGYRKNNREPSPDRGRARRESPPPFKRRRKEDWESRFADRNAVRNRPGRNSWSGDSDLERARNARLTMYEGSMKTYKQFLEIQDDTITPEQAEKNMKNIKLNLNEDKQRFSLMSIEMMNGLRRNTNPISLKRRGKRRSNNLRRTFTTFWKIFKVERILI